MLAQLDRQLHAVDCEAVPVGGSKFDARLCVARQHPYVRALEQRGCVIDGARIHDATDAVEEISPLYDDVLGLYCRQCWVIVRGHDADIVRVRGDANGADEQRLGLAY